MERNHLIGFILIFVILMWWSWMQPKKPLEVQEPSAIEAVEAEDLNASGSQDAIEDLSHTMPTDSVALQNAMAQYGTFGALSLGEEKVTTLENDVFKVDFSNKGGVIKGVTLKHYFEIIENEAGEDVKIPLSLMSSKNDRFEYILNTVNRQITTNDLYFQTLQSGNSITFTANTSNGGVIEQIYTLERDSSYAINYELKINGLSNTISRGGTPVILSWKNDIESLEKNIQFEKRYSSLYYKIQDENSDYCSCTGDDTDEKANETIKWFSNVNQFFNSTLMSINTPFKGGVFSVDMDDDDENGLLKTALTQVNLPYSHTTDQSYEMRFFIGPNEYDLLKSYDNKLEEIIPFGRSIFGTINRVIIRPSFNFLSKFIGSKGIVIIVLIFIIKMILYPLYYRMLHSQAKMSVLKPDLASLKTKFKDDNAKIQMETMKVYREYGVSPFGGCLPMLVQAPIWYALFRFFPASIQFRQEKFLWANDLSSYDAFINLPFDIPVFGGHLSLFTILWAISTLLYTYYNTKHMDMSANPAMKYVQYLMPVMFFVYFNNYASGLTCYLFFSNFINIAQTVITKNFIFDDKKIRQELDKKKAKPKKKGKFQARFEEALKQQQQMQEKNKKNRKK